MIDFGGIVNDWEWIRDVAAVEHRCEFEIIEDVIVVPDSLDESEIFMMLKLFYIVDRSRPERIDDRDPLPFIEQTSDKMWTDKTGALFAVSNAI